MSSAGSKIDSGNKLARNGGLDILKIVLAFMALTTSIATGLAYCLIPLHRQFTFIL